MTTTELKSNLHHLIDTIDNEGVLYKLYDLLSKVNQHSEGTLWNRLSTTEQDELIQIEKESYSLDSLISDSQVRNRFSEWL